LTQFEPGDDTELEGHFGKPFTRRAKNEPQASTKPGHSDHCFANYCYFVGSFKIMKYEIEHLELFFGKAFPCGESEKVLGNQSIK